VCAGAHAATAGGAAAAPLLVPEQEDADAPVLDLLLLVEETEAAMHAAALDARILEGRSPRTLERPSGRMNASISPVEPGARRIRRAGRRRQRGAARPPEWHHGWIPRRSGRPTPRGRFIVRNRLYGYDSPTYGPVAFRTSAGSPTLADRPAGGFVGIHGTDRRICCPGASATGGSVCASTTSGGSRLMPVELR
jgi:hypothetical protein